jgi:hypothetical protein
VLKSRKKQHSAILIEVEHSTAVCWKAAHQRTAQHHPKQQEKGLVAAGEKQHGE